MISNILYRRALGMVSLGEQCPTIDSYYMLRRIARYEEETGVDLFDKCFKGITRKQALGYRISGRGGPHGQHAHIQQHRLVLPLREYP